MKAIIVAIVFLVIVLVIYFMSHRSAFPFAGNWYIQKDELVQLNGE